MTGQKRAAHEVVDDVVGLEPGSPSAIVANGVEDSVLIDDRNNLKGG